jgi:hypothetical protein
VTGITGVPTEATAGTPLTLTGTVEPSTATNQTIAWSVKSAGATGAAIDGTTFTASAAGEAVVTATVAGGKTASTPYTRDFTIAVTPPVMTMTTAMEVVVSLYLQGTGTPTIDWGDGSPSETSAIASGESKTFRHAYSGTGSRTITITGGNVTGLNCTYNDLTALDVSKNTGLTTLDCGDNQLTALDVSKNTGLTYLYCDDNQLTSLDVRKNTGLTEFGCYGNQLTSLDVSKNTGLTTLGCYNNQLTSLDASGNTKLTDLWCHNNQFTAAGLNALFGTLHGNTVAGGKTVYVDGNPGAAGCDAGIATAKGWGVVR